MGRDKIVRSANPRLKSWDKRAVTLNMGVKM